MKESFKNFRVIYDSRLLLRVYFRPFAKLAFTDLFTVMTDRHRWIVANDSTNLAELAVDESVLRRWDARWR